MVKQVPQGPGQGETILGKPQPQAGTYRDPASKKELTVTMNAAADALVRMGWELVQDVKAGVNKVAVKVADETK